MKLILLAAAAIVATPALAQTTPTDPATNAPASGGMQSMPSSPDTATAPAPTTTDTMPAQSMPAQSGAAMSNQAGDPVGGYQPSAPPMSGPMQPGATVRFQQAPTPDQAYPAPAAMAHYPVCKPGQFDKCMQGPGSTHSRQVHGRGR